MLQARFGPWPALLPRRRPAPSRPPSLAAVASRGARASPAGFARRRGRKPMPGLKPRPAIEGFSSYVPFRRLDAVAARSQFTSELSRHAPGKIFCEYLVNDPNADAGRFCNTREVSTYIEFLQEIRVFLSVSF